MSHWGEILVVVMAGSQVDHAGSLHDYLNKDITQNDILPAKGNSVYYTNKRTDKMDSQVRVIGVNRRTYTKRGSFS